MMDERAENARKSEMLMVLIYGVVANWRDCCNCHIIGKLLRRQLSSGTEPVQIVASSLVKV